MRRAYAANVSVIDHEVGRILDALDDRGVLDDTWVIYTSDHGEMAGDHGPHVEVRAVRRRGAGAVARASARWCGCARRLGGRRPRGARRRARDHPAAVGAGEVPESEGRSLLGHVAPDAPRPSRAVVVSENWGFASFETEAYKLVVDEDALVPAPALRPRERRDRGRQPRHRSRACGHRRPDDGRDRQAVLLVPPVRNHPSFFTS